MRNIASTAAAACLIATPVLAQTGAPVATPAPTAAPAPAAGGLTLDTPLETIAAVPAGRAVLDKYLAPLMNSPVYEMAEKMSLRQIQPMSQGKLTPEMLDQIGAELAAIPPAA